MSMRLSSTKRSCVPQTKATPSCAKVSFISQKLKPVAPQQIVDKSKC